ncbi:hypothetical protein M2226_009537 [Bradyrhizobium elkanii]|nr:hypothetical protein [Bradyrhizobium elkanii]MCW2130738.1 hypothetical protein [Bradyrhizobium elkanii]MCW2175894.1 hypothetical protein [Bradyrhizobium elkanii]
MEYDRVWVGLPEKTMDRRLKGMNAQGRALRDLSRRMDFIIQEHQDTKPVRLGASSHANRIAQIKCGITRQPVPGPLSADQDDDHVDLECEMQEERRFLQRRRAMQNNDTRHIGAAPNDQIAKQD